jgi:hypothetical protein
VTTRTPTLVVPPGNLAERLAAIDWRRAEDSLRERPYARLGPVLTAEECASVAGLWSDEARFRSRVEMERFRFGVGQYKYFAEPLPPLVEALRTGAYPPLAVIANRWAEALGSAERFPATLEAFRQRCAQAGQREPTPLLLRYEAGGYNCLHQDLYGSIAFPLQVVAFLSQPGRDHTGGEFLLVEQRPRAQSVGEAVVGVQGELVAFVNRTRPVAGSRGHSRANVRHGLSRVHTGTRYALGIIFHDAR